MRTLCRFGLLLSISFLVVPIRLCAQSITLKDGEKWFGGAVNEAHLMPCQDGYKLNMYGDVDGRQ